MSEKELTFEELNTRYEDLQRQAAHSLVIGQNLIDAKDRLDRERRRDMEEPLRFPQRARCGGQQEGLSNGWARGG